MSRYDVIVVGGSCAGSAAAFTLARAGRRVLIIDKAVFPRTKLCGGMIPEKTVSLLSGIYGNPDVVARLTDMSSPSFAIHHARFGKVCKFSRPDRMLYFIDRERFDHYFLKQAQDAGCETVCGARVVHAGDGRVVIHSGQEISAPYIIGADGAMSAVRASLYGRPKKKDYAFALEADIGYEQLTCFEHGEELHPMIFFGYMNSGYGWVLPKKQFATVGLGGMVHANGAGMRHLFRVFLAGLLKAGVPFPERINGFPVPFRNLARKPGQGGVLLTGDAAGFVEPLTGEGIYYAVLSGALAAEAILGSSDPATRYNDLVRKQITPLFRQAGFAKSLYYKPAILRWAMRKMMGNAKYCKYYLDVLSGEMDYKAYIKTLLKDRANYASE